MKQFYITFLAFLLFSFTASAQVIVHHENFTETAPGAIAGVFAEPAGSWVFTDATPSTVALSSKGNYVRTTNEVSGTRSLYIKFSTLGYSNASVSWNQFRGSYRNNTLLTAAVELQYSINGGPRTTFYTTTNNTNDAWNKANNGAPIALPAIIMGLPEVTLYWKITFAVNNSNEVTYYALDDINITGTPEAGVSTFDWSARTVNENPFTASGTNAVTPYSTDGVTMRWSSAQSAGVTYETAMVDDKLYKAGTKAFALVQTGASATSVSIIQLDLSKPVEDLTFTIFDVDIAANQFSDKLTITGYDNGTQVPLVKNKVKTTSYNQFASAALSGVIPSDNASSDGDITITFPKAVTRVVIQYNNTATTRNQNGRQGIAIHNLTWKKEQQITALPVELTSFKAASQHNTAVLTWNTASEKDNDKYIIERSQDGKNFSKIGEVAGNGTSSRKLSYTYSDNKPLAGINYYRLRQVDFDGTTSYSKPVVLNFAAPKAGAAIATVFPTTATTQVTVALTAAAGTTDIVVTDATGKVVTRYMQVTDLKQIIEAQHLKAGIYFVTVTNGQVRETYRFMKQ